MKPTYPIINVICFAFTIVMNTLANTLPLNGYNTGQLSDLYPNLFVPAGITFSIWGIIYLVLTVWLLYFLFPYRKRSDHYRTYAIGPWFAISCLCNGFWILAWHYLYIGLSVLIMLGLFYSLCKIYIALYDRDAVWYVRLPFSIYLAWISVALIANITTLLVQIGVDGGSAAPIISTAMMCIATLLGLYFLLIKKDIVYALVIIWALYGIRLRHDIDIIETTSTAGISILSLLGIFMFIKKQSYITT